MKAVVRDGTRWGCRWVVLTGKMVPGKAFAVVDADAIVLGRFDSQAAALAFANAWVGKDADADAGRA